MQWHLLRSRNIAKHEEWDDRSTARLLRHPDTWPRDQSKRQGICSAPSLCQSYPVFVAERHVRQAPGPVRAKCAGIFRHEWCCCHHCPPFLPEDFPSTRAHHLRCRAVPSARIDSEQNTTSSDCAESTMSSTCSGLLHCASTLAITGAERDVLNLALAASQPRSSSFLQRAGRGYCRYCFFHDCFHYCLSKNKPLRLGFMRRAAGPVALAATLAAIHTLTKQNSLFRQPSNARPNKGQPSGNRYMPVQPK